MTLQSEGYQLGLRMCERVYEEEEVPPWLIDIPSASKKHGISVQTIHTWLRRGHLFTQGRKRAAAKNGGYHLVSEEELLQCRDTPKSKGGRPPSAVR